ncbi:GNAT family N-acetyltransferase [Terribacillus aidingensis]|uniref:GNAT family N-acetyltransferase n=1 Tax=Terribacillus aidingensis TaxID=586416 RepID=UPI00344D106E
MKRHGLQHCEENFYGYYENEKLCGVVSIKVDDDVVDIHRLIVHPYHFRKGIAQLLLNFIETKFQVETIKVATGSKNTPAVSFYKKNGFQNINEVLVNEQLTLTFLKRKYQSKGCLN